MQNIFSLFPLFIFCAFSGVFLVEPCPNAKPVENFNFSAFHRGRWYEIARYDNDFEKKGDCIHADHYIENGRNILKFMEVVDKKNVESFYVYIDLNPDAGNSGLIDYFSRNMSAPEGDNLNKITLTVLDVDYNNYMIAYRCAYNEETKQLYEYSWIAARTKKLDSATKIAVENFIKGTGFLDINKFIWDHFDLDICNT